MDLLQLLGAMRSGALLNRPRLAAPGPWRFAERSMNLQAREMDLSQPLVAMSCGALLNTVTIADRAVTSVLHARMTGVIPVGRNCLSFSCGEMFVHSQRSIARTVWHVWANRRSMVKSSTKGHFHGFVVGWPGNISHDDSPGSGGVCSSTVMLRSGNASLRNITFRLELYPCMHLNFWLALETATMLGRGQFL